MPNPLANSSSPYLRQHADNPVDWMEWGPAAFDVARERNLPLFVSVGYSSCHWCHVMANESFSDPAVGELLNANFVCVKVDREEHPDVDQAMMTATQALTGQGGWPNSVFLTPEGEPFFAGTYFPPVARPGMPSFTDVVAALADAWRNRNDELLASANAIASQLRSDIDSAAGDRPNAVELVERVLADFDVEHGGFGGAPKFPNAPTIDALLVRTDPEALAAALTTLESMARGGIHDQIGGGFHRYAVDEAWEVPHFEKMLYDNALLLGSYVRGWRRAVPGAEGEQRELFTRVIEGIVSWLEREMLLPSGAFAASLDADSLDESGEHVEGAYYLWSPKLLDEALLGNSLFAQGLFHVTPNGNMPHGHEAPTDGTGLSTLQFHGLPDPDRTRRVIELLRQARELRPAPSRDDKVVTAWNGWLIDSLVTAAMTLGRQEWLTMAKRAGEYLWQTHWRDGTLVRSSLDGELGPEAVTSDYAALGLGFARLASATGDGSWLERAVRLLDEALTRFSADDGGFFDAASNELLFDRPRSLFDESVPSATGSMIQALRLVGELAERPDFLMRAQQAAQTLWLAAEQAPRFAGSALTAMLEDLEAANGHGPAQIVVVTVSDAVTDELVQAAWRLAPSGSFVLSVKPDADGFGHWLTGRSAIDGASAAYICRGQTCLEPITDWSRLREPLWGASPHAH